MKGYTMNTINLIGRLTKDASIRYLENGGKAVGNFIIAVNRPYKNNEGKTDADFINCSVFGKIAENLVNFTKKGSRIAVVGRIQTRNYNDNDGKKVFVTEVIAESIEFLDPKPNGNSGQQPQGNYPQNNHQQGNYQQQNNYPQQQQRQGNYQQQSQQYNRQPNLQQQPQNNFQGNQFTGDPFAGNRAPGTP